MPERPEPALMGSWCRDDDELGPLWEAAARLVLMDAVRLPADSDYEQAVQQHLAAAKDVARLRLGPAESRKAMWQKLLPSHVPPGQAMDEAWQQRLAYFQDSVLNLIEAGEEAVGPAMYTLLACSQAEHMVYTLTGIIGGIPPGHARLRALAQLQFHYDSRVSDLAEEFLADEAPWDVYHATLEALQHFTPSGDHGPDGSTLFPVWQRLCDEGDIVQAFCNHLPIESLAGLLHVAYDEDFWDSLWNHPCIQRRLQAAGGLTLI